MAKPNKASNSNGALWVIAGLLGVIAMCLVVLVVRQGNRTKYKVLEATELPSSTTTTTAEPPKPIPPMRLHIRPTAVPEPVPSPANEASSTAESSTASHPPVFQIADAQPVFAGGFAPLTSLSGTNSVTTITGRVVLKGKPPMENLIKPDPTCGKENADLKTTRFYVVSTNGELANVFVYISGGLEGKRFAAPKEPVLLEQKGCLYEPYVLGLMVNQKLRIKNSDPFFHNVHSIPTADRGNQAFNFGEGPEGVIEKSFRSPEIPLRIKCDVHPWMYAYACVVEHPFFAVTDAEGKFSITNVPPGRYVLEAYHVKTHGVRHGERQKITVGSGETAVANFTIELPTATGRIALSK